MENKCIGDDARCMDLLDGPAQVSVREFPVGPQHHDGQLGARLEATGSQRHLLARLGFAAAPLQRHLGGI